LREIFVGKYILKVHSYNKKYSKLPVVVTYRHPIDCVTSLIQLNYKAPTDDIIEKEIIKLNENGIWNLLEVKDYSNVLMLMYERIIQDIDYVFDKIKNILE